MTSPVIVIVEPDPTIASLLHDVLTDEGYTPRVWHERQSAFTFVRDLQPALILIDPWLQHPDEGRVLIDRLINDSATAHIPIIVCSGAIKMLEQLAPMLPSGCHMLVKPFDLDDLLDNIASRISRGSALRRHDPGSATSSALIVAGSLTSCLW